MAGSDSEIGGARITPQELFDHVATLVGLSYDNVERAAVLHDQAQRSFNALGTAHTQSLQRLQALTEELRQKYALTGVESAALSARDAAAAFSSRVQSAADDLLIATKRAQTAFWTRTLGGAALALVMVVATVVIINLWVPSLDQLQQRREELAELDGKLQILRGVFEQNGMRWVPVIASGKICDPADGTRCQFYGRVK
jgi:hypothetical protein